MRTLVIGTAGHIDHGKSALVRALTGVDPDRLKEEQERGITIDLGFAHAEVDGTVLSFVDVPGHERFVRNMLAGAGGVDTVLLVIAADESVMPQTREHFHICRLLGVRSGVIALTKSDLADADLTALAALEARELTAGSFLDGAPVIPVSVRSGEGLEALRTALAGVPAAERPGGDRPARLPIDRVFTIRGFGTVATGTLSSGRLAPDDDLEILPRGRLVKVRGLQVHGVAAAGAGAGQRVAVNLAGIEVADLSRGHTLAAPGSLLPSRVIDVAVDTLSGARIVHGARLRLHQGTAEVLGRIALAGPRAGDGPAAEIPPGGQAYARIRLEAPLVVTRGDRFILRAYSPPTTIGGGIVLDPSPPRGGIRTKAGRARLQRFDAAADDESVVRALLAERGAAAVDMPMLVARLGLSTRKAAAIMGGLVARGAAIAAGDGWLAAAATAALGTALVALVDEHHRREPLADGLPREEARERLFARAAPAVFETVVGGLVRDGRLAGRERLALAGRRVELSGDEARALSAIEEAVRAWGLQPGDGGSAPGVGPADAERLTGLLVRRGRIVRLDGLLFHREALDRLVADVRAMKAQGIGHVDVPAFKTRYGLTRKFAIPLLEYLDRERVTRRMGDRRVIF